MRGSLDGSGGSGGSVPSIGGAGAATGEDEIIEVPGAKRRQDTGPGMVEQRKSWDRIFGRVRPPSREPVPRTASFACLDPNRRAAQIVVRAGLFGCPRRRVERG